MKTHPHEPRENHTPSPKHSFITFNPPLDPPYRIPADPQRVPHAVQPPLRPLQYLPLLMQVTQHGAPALEVLVDLAARLA